jgi:hypothetical protein
MFFQQHPWYCWLSLFLTLGFGKRTSWPRHCLYGAGKDNVLENSQIPWRHQWWKL